MGWFTSQPNRAKVASKIDEIEAEMKHIAMWQEEPMPPGCLPATTAFGQGQMSFEQWLQFVLIPNVRQILAEGRTFPSRSEVAAQAFREWFAWGHVDNTDRLFELLSEFDDLFGWSGWTAFRKFDELIDRWMRRPRGG